MSKNITIPEGAFLFKNWKVGGFYEIKEKGKTYRAYCLSKIRIRKSGIIEELRGYSAMTKKEGKTWRGILVSDTSYYARKLKPIDLIRQLKRRKRKRRK